MKTIHRTDPRIKRDRVETPDEDCPLTDEETRAWIEKIKAELLKDCSPWDRRRLEYGSKARNCIQSADRDIREGQNPIYVAQSLRSEIGLMLENYRKWK